MSLPPLKIKQIQAESRKLLEAGQISTRALSRLVGKMSAASQVIPPAPLFYRSLQIDLKAALRASDQDYESLLVLGPESRDELIWWDSQMIKWNGRTVLTTEPDLTIESDTSKQGWGVSCQGDNTGGRWSAEEMSQHINCLELLAATLALKSFAKGKTRASKDNTTAVAYINNQGGTVSKELIALTKNIWMWCLERNIHIQAQHLPGAMNTRADLESRAQRDWSDWKLDCQTFLRINTIYGPLEVNLFESATPTPNTTNQSHRVRPTDNSVSRVECLRESLGFQAKLQNSSLGHGEIRQTSLTTHSLGDGIAGVVNEVQIHFWTCE